MHTVTTIGLDIAKSVFQVRGIDEEGGVVVRQQLKRSRVLAFFKKLAPCKVGIEACASSHARTHSARPRSQAHAAGLREALRQAAEERRS